MLAQKRHGYGVHFLCVFGRRHVFHEVHLAILEGHHSSATVIHNLKDELIGVGWVPLIVCGVPIGWVAAQGNGLPCFPFVKHVWARPNIKPCIALYIGSVIPRSKLFECCIGLCLCNAVGIVKRVFIGEPLRIKNVLGHNPQSTKEILCKEIWLRHGDDHSLVIRRRNVLHRLIIISERSCIRDERIFYHLITEDHIFSAEGLTIAKAHAIAQFKSVCQVIIANRWACFGQHRKQLCCLKVLF